MEIKRKRSIRTRLLLANTGFVVIAFVTVFGIFNLFMERYISSTATQQLEDVVTHRKNYTKTSTDVDFVPNLQSVSGGPFNTHPVVFNITSKYEVKNTEETSGYNVQLSNRIAANLKSSNIDLAHIEDKRLLASGSTFYISSIKTGLDTYELFFVDVTGITNFSNSVNFYFLLIALAVLVIVSLSVWFITRRITEPILNLAAFAKKIGKGEFEPSDKIYHDRELDILSQNLNSTAIFLDNYDKDQKIFFQNVSHELRTPLMSIKSYAEGIQYDVMEPIGASKTIIQETDRMAEMVEDILTISRIESLNQIPELSGQDVREVFEDIQEEFKTIAKNKNISFVNLISKKPIYMLLNYKSLRRAISNLTSNSMRYAKKEIFFTCIENDQFIELIVANDGEPIAKESMDHIFERFYKGKGGVHGIGLSIVKSVVEEHGGTIRVESDDKKTAFIMIFPKKSKKMRKTD